MKLIDADKLIPAVNGAFGDEYVFLGHDARIVLNEILQAQETVKAKPVVHAKWIKNKCSACGHEAYWDDVYGWQNFKYCPYCGALMDEDMSEDE